MYTRKRIKEQVGKREKTKYTGVYQRVHTTRRYAGRPDICYDITYKNPDGRKIWEKIGWISEGYSAALALEVRSERLRRVRHGDISTVSNKQNITFAKAFTEFDKRHLYLLKSSEEDRRRFHAYLSSIHDKYLNVITPFDIDDIKRKMTISNYSPQTIKHALGLVRRVYRKCIEWGLYSGGTPTFSMPKIDAARTRFLQPEEAERLLSALKKRSVIWHDIALLSLKTGMRLGEILSLRREDVDLKSKVANLRDAKAGSRAVLLSKEACNILQNYMTSTFGIIFPARGSSGLGKSTRVSKSFILAVKDVGLNEGIIDNRQKVVFHTLRHTFASWLALKGTPLYVIGELMGHKTLEMTRRYSHLCPDAKRDAIQSIDDLV